MLSDDAGAVWRGWSFLQPEGSWQRVTVSAGVLTDAGSYVLRARTTDSDGLRSARWSRPVRIDVDLPSTISAAQK